MQTNRAASIHHSTQASRPGAIQNRPSSQTQPLKTGPQSDQFTRSNAQDSDNPVLFGMKTKKNAAQNTQGNQTNSKKKNKSTTTMDWGNFQLLVGSTSRQQPHGDRVNRTTHHFVVHGNPTTQYSINDVETALKDPRYIHANQRAEERNITSAEIKEVVNNATIYRDQTNNRYSQFAEIFPKNTQSKANSKRIQVVRANLNPRNLPLVTVINREQELFPPGVNEVYSKRI